MSSIRVHQLAAELGTSSAEILGLLHGHGFFVKSASSRLEQLAVDWLRFEFSSDAPRPLPPATITTRSPGPGFRPRTGPWTDGEWLGIRPWRRFRGLPSFPDPEAFTPRTTNRVPVMGGPDAARSLNLDAVTAGLTGSPYSLPDQQADYLARSFLPRMAALSIRAQREARKVAGLRLETLRRRTRSSEIYQSNRLEGLGPDFATTDAVLDRHNLHRRADVSVAQQAIERCISEEPKVRDVVGLGAARLLAEIFCSDPDRPLTESDVRELHSLILVGDSRRGKYKEYINSISGSGHTPPSPADTPEEMHRLITWLASTELAPMWRAAVAHAWLTHIHPFHDGNGRVARLLSNLILIREGIPPLVIRAEADRGAYISALAESDTGGDILPLARVFRDVLGRAVTDLSTVPTNIQPGAPKPHGSDYGAWVALLQEFLDELAPHLLLSRLNLYRVGGLTSSDLRRLRDRRSENIWLAKVGVAGGDRDLLLHVATPTTANRRQNGSEIMPSIFVSIKNDRPLDARQYVPVGRTGFAYEFTPMAADATVLVRRGSGTRELHLDDAASAVAEHLARIYTQIIGQPR